MLQELYDQYLENKRLLMADKTADAKAILVGLCEQDNSNPFTECDLASILARENDFIAAAKLYLKAKRVIQINDKGQFKDIIELINSNLYNLTDVLSEEGGKLINEGNFDKAELYLRVTKEVGNIYANYNLATLETKRKQYGQAREHLKESLDTGLQLFASPHKETKEAGAKLLANTHNLLGTFDIQGFGCTDEKPNVLKAMQNFISSLAFVPDYAPAIANKKHLESMIKPQSMTFFQNETTGLKMDNGRLSFCNFIFAYTSTPNIDSYIKENPDLNHSSAIDDLLSNYLAGTSKKISFEEELPDILGSKMSM